MTKTMTKIADPDCLDCDGTGTDVVFGDDCHCLRDAKVGDMRVSDFGRRYETFDGTDWVEVPQADSDPTPPHGIAKVWINGEEVAGVKSVTVNHEPTVAAPEEFRGMEAIITIVDEIADTYTIAYDEDGEEIRVADAATEKEMISVLGLPGYELADGSAFFKGQRVESIIDSRSGVVAGPSSPKAIPGSAHYGRLRFIDDEGHPWTRLAAHLTPSEK